MDVSLLIRQRLNELGLDQKDLALAVHVTESYISQLLTRKKAPPAPGRTDLYDKISDFLALPSGDLARLAEAQRLEELKRKIAAPPRALFHDFRELILSKCATENRRAVRRIFEKEPFGELERLVTQKILDVVHGVARDELRTEGWLRSTAQAGGRTYEQMRVILLEFLDTDVLHISAQTCGWFIDPVVDSWNIDLATFSLEIVVSDRHDAGAVRRFEFMEKLPEQPRSDEPGLEQFLSDPFLCGNASDEEIEFLKALSLFHGRKPTALYYYRELQNLRDPLHFEDPDRAATTSKRTARNR